MKIITLLNEKGGVGKTTLATHIAAGLAIQGQRVVLVDADSQAHATTQCGIDDGDGVYRLMVKYAEWRDLLRQAPIRRWGGGKGELWVLPSNIETRVIPMLVNDVWLLKKRLAELEDFADVVIIDTSPTPSMLHAQIYMATDYIIYPTWCELLSLIGLNASIEHTQTANEGRLSLGMEKIDILGAQPVMFDPRTKAHSLGISMIAKTFKNRLWPALPVRTIWRDAAWHNRLLFAYAPDDVATQEAWALVDRVERGIML
jgi:chromosome partitioning protein